VLFRNKKVPVRLPTTRTVTTVTLTSCTVYRNFESDAITALKSFFYQLN